MNKSLQYRNSPTNANVGVVDWNLPHC